MKLDIGAVLRDAWAMAKRDRDVLIGVAGVFLLVPQYWLLLFLAPQPAFPGMNADPAAIKAYTDLSSIWLATYGPGVLIAAIMAIFGQVTITALYVDRARPTVGAVLAYVPLRFFPALLVIVIGSPLGVALLIAPLLFLPAAYLGGRLMLTMPILLGERPVSVLSAVSESWRRTAGNGLLSAGLICITLLSGYVLAGPFVLLSHALDGAPMHNPVVAALLDGCAAIGATVGAVATFLVQIALYRRLSSGI